MNKTITAFWTSFKTKPMKFGVGFLLISLSFYMFFGDIKIKASHGDTKIELTTKDEK